MYSCALWGPEEGGINGDLEPAPSAGSSPSSSTETLVTDEPSSAPGALEAAQQRKITRVLRRLRLPHGGRLLEFGTGWGALAIEAARTYGVDVDTLTLSAEQKRLAEERVREAALEGRVRVHLMDYREIPREWDGVFDAFVSVEMIEVRARHFASRAASHRPLVYRSMSAQSTTARTSHSLTAFSRRPMRPHWSARLPFPRRGTRPTST